MKNRVGLRILECLRPSQSLIEKFKGLPSSNIGDQMGRLYNANSTLKSFANVELCGPAFTVKVPQGDNLMFHKALDLAKPGDVIVVDGEGDRERALAGEMMILYAKKRDLAGFVINGCVRDLDAIETLDFPVYAVGITPQGPLKNGPGEINVPICCGGRVVCPGDIIVGDRDGIVIIPQEDAGDILQASIDKYELEQTRIRDNDAGDRSWVDKQLEKL